MPRSIFTRAVALSSSSFQLASIAGPALGGLFFGFGAATVYAICAVLLLIGSLAVARIKITAPSRERRAAGFASLFAGFAFIWAQPIVLGSISLDLVAVLLGGATALLPIYARDILSTGPLGLGLLRAAPAIGALAMSLVLARFPLRRKAGPRMFLSVALFGLATIVFAISGSMVVSVLALIVLGAADMVSVVVRSSLIQLQTPDAMRGRVGAVNSLFIGTSNQLGEFESGVTAAWLGPVPAVIIGGIGTLLAVAFWMRLFPQLRRLDRLDSVAVEPEEIGNPPAAATAAEGT